MSNKNDQIQMFLNSEGFQRNYMIMFHNFSENILRELSDQLDSYEWSAASKTRLRKYTKDFVKEFEDKLKINIISQSNKFFLSLFDIMQFKNCSKNTQLKLSDPEDTNIFFPIFILFFFRLGWKFKQEQTSQEDIDKFDWDELYKRIAVPYICNCFEYKSLISEANDKRDDFKQLVENIKANITKIIKDYKRVIIDNFVNGDNKFMEISMQINQYLSRIQKKKDIFETLKSPFNPLYIQDITQ